MHHARVQVKEKRDQQRATAEAASAALAAAGEDLVALPEGEEGDEEEDIYEIPQALMNAMMGDGGGADADDDPDYAEIGDDMAGQEDLYCEPSEFRPLNEEADYEDMLEQIEEDLYVEAVPIAGEGEQYDLGDTYNNMHEGIYNSPVDSPDSAGGHGADHDENYDNKGAAPELDDYGIGDEDDPYTFAGMVSPAADAPTDSDDDGEVYSVANEARQSEDVPAPSEGDDYGLFTTLRRKPTDFAMGETGEEEEEDTYSNTHHTLRRQQGRDSDYGNAASVGARGVLSPEDADLYENSERVIHTLHRPPRRTTEYDYQHPPPPRATIDSTYDGAVLDGYGDGHEQAEGAATDDDENPYGCSEAEAAGLGGSFTGANAMFLKLTAGSAAAKAADVASRPSSVASGGSGTGSDGAAADVYGMSAGNGALEGDARPRMHSAEYIDANFVSLPRGGDGLTPGAESVHYADANFSPGPDADTYSDAGAPTREAPLLGYGGTAFMEEDMHARIVYMSDGTLQRVGGAGGDVDPYVDIDGARVDATSALPRPAVQARRRSEATYAVVQRSIAGMPVDTEEHGDEHVGAGRGGLPSPPAGFRPPLATPTGSLTRSQSARTTPGTPTPGEGQRASKKTTRVAPPTVLLDVLKRTALAQAGSESFPEPEVLGSPKAIRSSEVADGPNVGEDIDLADKSSLQRRSSMV